MNKAIDKRMFRKSHSDIRREDDKIHMILEIPGVKKEDLSINIEGDKLIIDGRKMQSESQGTWLVREISQGDYHMEFSIDETIDRESIEASLNQGVLELTLGLSEAVKPRRISVVSR